MATSTAPSPFAKLLRQSRFASYDPRIAKVYVSHGGHIHRGNYGFKRPLNKRKRGRAITMSAVDSREQQAEWWPADTQMRWLQRWEELGARVDVQPGQWVVKTGNRDLDKHYDSFFADASNVEPGQLPGSIETPEKYVPNSAAMSRKQFERYVAQLRTIRPQFSEYLHRKESREREQEMKRNPTITNLYNVNQFLREHDVFVREEETANNTLKPYPHRSGGLDYAELPKLMTRTYLRPAIARHLGYSQEQSRGAELVGVAGNASRLVKSQDVYDSSENGHQSSPKPQATSWQLPVRASAANLYAAPEVLNRNFSRDEGLNFRSASGATATAKRMLGTRLELRVQNASHESSETSNPFPHGSRAAIAFSSRIVKDPTLRPGALMSGVKLKKTHSTDTSDTTTNNLTAWLAKTMQAQGMGR